MGKPDRTRPLKTYSLSQSTIDSLDELNRRFNRPASQIIDDSVNYYKKKVKL